MYDSIYLLQTRESLFKNDNVFKIGRTSQDELKRFNCYPRGSKLHLHVSCFDGVIVEKNIIKVFTEKYSNAHLYGSEYFHGDLCQMISDILKIVGYSFDSIHDNEKLSKMFQEKNNAINNLTQTLKKEQEHTKYLQQQLNCLQKKLSYIQNNLDGRTSFLEMTLHQTTCWKEQILMQMYLIQMTTWLTLLKLMKVHL